MSKMKSQLYLETLNLKNQKRKAEDTLEAMKGQRLSFFNDGEDFEALGVCLSKYTDAEIENMNLEQLQNVVKEMNDVGFDLKKPSNCKTSEEYYLRDMISYFKNMIESENKLNELINQYDEEILKTNEELDDVMKEYSHSVVKLMRKEIENNPNFKDTKMGELYETIMQSFDRSFDLSPVLNIAREVDPVNTINDYKRNKDKVYKQYVSVLKRLNVKHNLKDFSNVQTMITDKEYPEYEDFLIFVLMKYIAKRGQSIDFSKKVDGVFASQLCTNMYLLASNVDDEVIQGKFKDSCRELLEIYLG